MRLFNKIKCGNRVKYKNKKCGNAIKFHIEKCGNVLKQYKVDLKERKSVIIFDEVQLCPPARQAIKTLVADHRYDYIETGSLISIKKNVKDILIPSEERKISMYPMDYEEFLWAIGDTSTFSLLKKCFDMNQGLGDSINRKQLRQL